MKKLISFLFFLSAVTVSAQSTMTITSVQVDPTPTFTSSATKVIVKLAMSKAGQKIMTVNSQNNFAIDIRVCFFESTTVTPVFYTDTFDVITFLPGVYSASVSYFVSHATDCNAFDTVSAALTFTVLNANNLRATEPDEILMYPNPVEKILNVDNYGAVEGNLRIRDSFGKIVFDTRITTREIDLSHLRAGLYYLEFLTGEQLIRRKMIKK